MSLKTYILRGKCLITISVAFMMITIGVIYQEYFKDVSNTYNLINIQDVNIKDMASPKVVTKKTNLISISSINEVDMGVINGSFETIVNRRVWYRPVEYGVITSQLSYSHTGIDITSPRGSNEVIYPIANGVISGIYTDSAGAKIVAIHHLIDGVNYTSLYVHLSSYASGLYVGREVTINDPLGHMGRTGIATGVHLHLEVADCSLFDPNDSNCHELGGYFRYEKLRYRQGYRGANNVLDLPSSWSER